MKPIKAIVLEVDLESSEMVLWLETGPRIKFPAKPHITPAMSVQVLWDYSENCARDVKVGWEESEPPTPTQTLESYCEARDASSTNYVLPDED